MKKIFAILLFGVVCANAFAISYQSKNDFLYYQNYYNPAMRFHQDGIYIHGFAGYTFNMPALAGKEPLDINCSVMAAQKNYSLFASVEHSEYSYFCGVCLTGGGNYIWDIKGSGHKLSFGGRFSLGLNSVDFTVLNYPLELDEETRQNFYRAKIIPTPDIDLGIEYSYKYFHAGVSVKNCIGYEGKYKDICYVCWPRSYMLTLRGDPQFFDGKFKVEPFATVGLNQNIYLVAGIDFTIWKNYRIGYSFRGPDLFHNIYTSINIMDRVELNVGYSLTPSHKYSMLQAGITVKLSR